MKSIKLLKNLFMIFVSISLAPLFLCSCATIKHRADLADKHGLSEKKLPLVEGKWNNENTVPYSYTLWEFLTFKEIVSSNAVVELKILNERTLAATLLINGVKTDVHTFKFKQRTKWFELSMQYNARPLLWYFFWTLQDRNIALGVDDNGNLLLNSIGTGGLMILFLPTPLVGGGGYGNISLYERVDEEPSGQSQNSKRTIRGNPENSK